MQQRRRENSSEHLEVIMRLENDKIEGIEAWLKVVTADGHQHLKKFDKFILIGLDVPGEVELNISAESDGSAEFVIKVAELVETYRR